MNFAVFASKLRGYLPITSTPGKVRSKFKMFHLSNANDAQNQDFADICGENQGLSASENRVAMENRN